MVMVPDINRQLVNIENRLREIHGCTQLVNAINRELIERPPHQIGEFDETVAKIAATAIGVVGVAVAAKGITAYAGIVVLASNPAGWAIAGGAVVGGSLGYWFASGYIDSYKEQSAKVAADMKTLVLDTYRIQLTYQQTKEIPVPLINELKDRLITAKYLTAFSAYNFGFNEDMFKKIGSWYPEDVKNQIIHGSKFLILSSLASLPAQQRPTDLLISNLDITVRNLANETLKNSGKFILGMLYLDKQDSPKAYEQFSSIPTTSDLHPLARGTMWKIQDMQKQLLKESSIVSKL